MTLAELWRQCGGIVPELVLSATLCAVLVLDMFLPLRRSNPVTAWVSLGGTLAALAGQCLVIAQGAAARKTLTFGGMIVLDQPANFFKLVFLVGLAATFLFSLSSRAIRGYRQGEYCSLLLGAVLGACFLACANHYVLFLVGLETLSLCSYVLAGFLKHDRRSAEAGLKYMLYGAVATGILLFGLSFLYGLTGTLDIGGGMQALAALPAGAASVRLGVLLVLLLVLAGVGFKIAMVPFHFWCPDVYEGSPTPVTAFLSVVSKAAGFSALIRIFLPLFSGPFPAGSVGAGLTTLELPVLFGVLSVVTMTFGNLVAMRQDNLKRLLAYSSIAHAGYLLLGMTAYNAAALESMYFYLVIYLLMNLGAFWVVLVIENRRGTADIGGCRGAAYQSPLLFVAMFIFLISLTGIPPTAGFVGKLLLFKVVVGAAIDSLAQPAGGALGVFYLAVALIGLLNSGIALYYYMRIARTMAFERPGPGGALGESRSDRALAVAFALPVLALLYFAPVLWLIQWAGR